MGPAWPLDTEYCSGVQGCGLGVLFVRPLAQVHVGLYLFLLPFSDNEMVLILKKKDNEMVFLKKYNEMVDSQKKIMKW